MEFRILGSIEVLDGTRQVELPRGRCRALLALLIMHAPKAVPTERLIDELWGEDPAPTARTMVHGFVSRLRGALEPERAEREPSGVLQTVDDGYRLAVDPLRIDANLFERLVDEARDVTGRERLTKLDAALDLWRGHALADLVHEPFAQSAITELERLKVDTLEDRFETALSIGTGDELVLELEGFVSQHPFRERAYGLLMLALYRTGRQTDALEVYRRARSVLKQEIGVEPKPALRDLHTSILRQDPVLELPGGLGGRSSTSETRRSWLPRERRTVTVVAVDLAPLVEPGVDPEAFGQVAGRAVRVATQVFERHGARVEPIIGDRLVAFFGFPRAHEDDGVRALHAAVEARTAVYALDEDPGTSSPVNNRLRVGIETGDVITSGPGAPLRDGVTGPVVSAAERLQQAARDGDLVVGPGTYELVRGAAVLTPAARARTDRTPQRAWRVAELVSHPGGMPRTLEAQMFGRQTELTRLRSEFRRVARTQTPGRTVIVGEPGIGKSRLVRELTASIGPAAGVLTLRYPAEGESLPFFPVRQAVVEAAGLQGWRGLHDLLSADHRQLIEKIAGAIQLPAERENLDAISSAMRHLLGTLVSTRPIITVFEDLQGADTAFLDVIDRLADETSGPIHILCVARPELLERRPTCRSPEPVCLEPLSTAEVEDLITDRAGPIQRETLEQIVGLSQGNPLFAEQLLAALEEDTIGSVPRSLRGLITSRLDSLGPSGRDVLRYASIIGMEVGWEEMLALLPHEAHPFLRRHLESLERKHLVERVGDHAFRFRHALIRLAAYQSMTHDDRARLHETFATWLQQDRPIDPQAPPPNRDRHLERAAELRRATRQPYDGEADDPHPANPAPPTGA